MSSDLVGKKIISIDFGIGEICSIKPEYDGANDFMEVVFSNTNVTNYFSIKNNKKYRIVESKDVLEIAITSFKSDHGPKEFESIKDKITYYGKTLKCNNIEDLAVELSILKNDGEIHTQIKKNYEKSLKSFVLEITYVLGVDEDAAWSLIEVEKVE